MENDAISIEQKKRNETFGGKNANKCTKVIEKHFRKSMSKIIDVNIRKEQACSQDNKKKTIFISKVNHQT